MLVVTRSIEETIVAGPVTFKLLGWKGSRAVIGVEAPPEVPILRGELLGQDRQKAAEARSANRDAAA